MVSDLETTIRKALEVDEWRRSQPYDGVLGQLPCNWPENFHHDFLEARNRLLRNGHKAEDLVGYIHENLNIQRQALAGELKGAFHPGIPFQIWRDIEVLTRFFTAVGLGCDIGLAFLTDPEHAANAKRGEKILDSARKGHEATHGTFEEKEARHTLIRQTCEQVAEAHPSWGLTAIRQETSERLGISLKTVQRATPDLKSLLGR